MTISAGSLDDFRRFVLVHPLGVVATSDADGRPEAALVSLAVAQTGDLVFNSLASARKIENLNHRPEVAVVVGCTGDETIQVEGRAVVETGAGRDAAIVAYLAAFPGARTDPAQIAFVTVRPSWTRYYRVGPGGFEPPLNGT